MRTRFLLYTLVMVFLAIGQSNHLKAQDDAVIEELNLFPDRFKSLQFYVAGAELSMPIAALGRTIPLEFRFDDLEHGQDFSYSLIHCDRNWIPSRIPANEYIVGWERERLREFSFSSATRVSYTHNWLRLPNTDMDWLLSGNYALMIYDEDWSDESPVIIRKFMVVDRQVVIYPQMAQALGATGYNTAQEININVKINKGVKIARPQQELSLTLVQNQQWDKSVENAFATVELNEKLVWNRPRELQFKAGKDYRSLDLRSARAPMGTTKFIEREENEIVALLTPDEPREDRVFIDNADLNGAFIILDEDLTFDPYRVEDYARDARNLDVLRLHTQTEYIKVLFTLLQRGELPDHDVYVTGSWCDWEIRQNNQMVWEPEYEAYMTTDLIKQGYYDYEYVVVPRDGVDYEVDVEGDWFETENFYTAFVYYRPYGARYDQLVGVQQFSSNR